MEKEYKRKIAVRASVFSGQALMILLTLLALFPLYFMFVTSLKTKQEFLFNKFAPPIHFTLSNYPATLRGGERFLRWFLNSMLVTTSSVLIGLICAILAAYAFANFSFQGRRTLFNLAISLMLVPPVTIAVPLFGFMNSLRLIDTYFSIIIVYVGLILPFSIYIMTSFFVSIPKEMIEAGLIDGCSLIQILWKIVVPLSLPAVITVIVVNALFIWNELLIAMVFLQSDNMRTLMAGIMSFKSKYNTDIPITMAGLSMISLPMIVLYLAGTKYFIRGFTTGSLKE